MAGFDYVESLYGNNLHIIGVPKSMQYHNMEWITRGAVDFIDRYRDQPFFLYMAPTLPHVPGPLASLKADPRITAAGMLDEPITGVQPSRESVFGRTRAAGIPDENAPMTWLDDGIGAVLQRLEEYGILEHTIVVFASDHQSPRAKMTCYEDAANAPAAIMWKGHIPEGVVSDVLVSNIDVVPTLLDLTGVGQPENYLVDGESWREFLGTDSGRSPRVPEEAATAGPVHESLYLEVVYQRAVVTPEWKYIAVRFPDTTQVKITPENRNQFNIEGRMGPDRYHNHTIYPGYHDDDQLYFLPDDPDEQNNLAGYPEYGEQLDRMKIMLGEYTSVLPFAFGEFH